MHPTGLTSDSMGQLESVKPMKRTGANLKKYKIACILVIKRADNRCEAIIEDKRCAKYIAEPKWINFAHKKSRNGASDEDVCNPDNIIFTCESHHINSHTTGEKLEMCEYGDEEFTYIPDYN